MYKMSQIRSLAPPALPYLAGTFSLLSKGEPKDCVLLLKSS
jgi:hypothetical protein